MSQTPGIRTVAAFLLGFGCVVSLASEPLGALAGPERAVFRRVNEVREQHHLLPLRPNSSLASVALAHAEDMARQGYRSHIGLDGRNPLERVQSAGIRGFSLLAENIGASSVREARTKAVVQEWLRSPLHRENLLNPAFNTTGIGIAEAADGTTIYVQLFASFSEPSKRDRPADPQADR
jgi:uncharacterized protein YkwD